MQFFKATAQRFSSYVDLNLLCKDSTGSEVEKYFDYPLVDKFRTSKELVEFWNKYKDKIAQDYSSRQEYVSNNKKELKISPKSIGEDSQMINIGLERA